MKKRNFISTAILTGITGVALAQQRPDAGAIEGVFQEAETTTGNVTGTIINILIFVVAAVAIFQIVSVFGGRLDADDKRAKMGLWVFLLGFAALAFVMVNLVFGV